MANYYSTIHLFSINAMTVSATARLPAAFQYFLARGPGKFPQTTMLTNSEHLTFDPTSNLVLTSPCGPCHPPQIITPSRGLKGAASYLLRSCFQVFLVGLAARTRVSCLTPSGYIDSFESTATFSPRIYFHGSLTGGRARLP